MFITKVLRTIVFFVSISLVQAQGLAGELGNGSSHSNGVSQESNSTFWQSDVCFKGNETGALTPYRSLKETQEKCPKKPLAGLSGPDYTKYPDLYNTSLLIFEARSKHKAACGCDLNIQLIWDKFKEKDRIQQVNYSLNSMIDEVAGHCNDRDAKAAICKMKTLEFSSGDKPGFIYKQSIGKVTNSKTSHMTWAMMARQVDK